MWNFFSLLISIQNSGREVMKIYGKDSQTILTSIGEEILSVDNAATSGRLRVILTGRNVFLNSDAF